MVRLWDRPAQVSSLKGSPDDRETFVSHLSLLATIQPYDSGYAREMPRICKLFATTTCANASCSWTTIISCCSPSSSLSPFLWSRHLHHFVNPLPPSPFSRILLSRQRIHASTSNWCPKAQNIHTQIYPSCKSFLGSGDQCLTWFIPCLALKIRLSAQYGFRNR